MPYDEVAELKRQIAQLEIDVVTRQCEIGRLQDAVLREKVSRQVERAAIKAGVPPYALPDVDSRALEHKWELGKDGIAYRVGPGGILELNEHGERITPAVWIGGLKGKAEAEHLFHAGGASPPAVTAPAPPAGTPGVKNPYLRGQENWTEQGRLEQDNPALARQLAAAADAAAGRPGSNPFAKESWNLTQQGEIYKRSPATARAMAEQAGVKPPA